MHCFQANTRLSQARLPSLRILDLFNSEYIQDMFFPSNPPLSCSFEVFSRHIQPLRSSVTYTSPSEISMFMFFSGRKQSSENHRIYNRNRPRNTFVRLHLKSIKNSQHELLWKSEENYGPPCSKKSHVSGCGCV